MSKASTVHSTNSEYCVLCLVTIAKCLNNYDIWKNVVVETRIHFWSFTCKELCTTNFILDFSFSCPLMLWCSSRSHVVCYDKTVLFHSGWMNASPRFDAVLQLKRACCAYSARSFKHFRPLSRGVRVSIQCPQKSDHPVCLNITPQPLR